MRVLKALLILAWASIGHAAYLGNLENLLYARYVCTTKPNGYRTLVPGSCSQYYECQYGRSRLQSCPLYFDGTKGTCVLHNPGCVETLGGKNAFSKRYPSTIGSDIAVEKNPLTKDLPKISKYLEIICHDKNDGTLLPSVTSCHEFYLCSNGRAQVHSCKDRYFNTERNVCDLPKNTKCNLEIPTEENLNVPLRENPTGPGLIDLSMTEQKNIELYLKYICLAKPNGFNLASYTSCREYYSCSEGKAIQHSCGHGQYFNSQTGSCDLPENSECFLETKRKDLEIQPKPLPEYQQEPSLKDPPFIQPSKFEIYRRFICRGKPNGLLMASLEKCNEFYACENGLAQVHSCGLLHFNGLKSACDLPQNSQCLLQTKPEKSSISSPATFKKSSSSSSSTAVSLYKTYVCRNKANGEFLVSLEKCNEYYVCQNGLAETNSCGKLFFNMAKGICDLPENTKCIIDNSPANDFTDESKNEKIEIPPIESKNESHKVTSIELYKRFVCRDKPDNYVLSSLNSCSEYYICSGGNTLVKSCGLKFFNASKGSCDLPENTKCIME